MHAALWIISCGKPVKLHIHWHLFYRTTTWPEQGSQMLHRESSSITEYPQSQHCHAPNPDTVQVDWELLLNCRTAAGTISRWSTSCHLIQRGIAWVAASASLGWLL